MQMQTRYPDFRVKQKMFVYILIPAAKHQGTVLAELHLNRNSANESPSSYNRLHVWWPALDTDIEQLVGDCQSYKPLTVKHL